MSGMTCFRHATELRGLLPMQLPSNMQANGMPRWETHKKGPMNHGNIRTFGKDGHLIYWGDAVTVLEEKVPDESANLIFADPPYSIGKRLLTFVINGRRSQNTRSGARVGLNCA